MIEQHIMSNILLFFIYISYSLLDGDIQGYFAYWNISLVLHSGTVNTQKGTISDRQKRLDPGQTPQAPRREAGLARPQMNAIRLTVKPSRISHIGGAPR